MKVEEGMKGSEMDSEGWQKWVPIQSEVTEDEIKDLEHMINVALPDSYKRFLKYKHFYDLHIGECGFCSHPVNNWKKSLNEMILNGYPKEFLLDKGRVPFANWSDWGLLCFDTTKKCENSNYPIVLWDHEVYNDFTEVYSDFESMIYELDDEFELND